MTLHRRARRAGRNITASDLVPDLADRLAKSLRVSGVRASEMATHLEVHPNTVSSWVNGRAKPNPASIRIWSQLTSVPYEWLRDGTEEKQ